MEIVRNRRNKTKALAVVAALMGLGGLLGAEAASAQTCPPGDPTAPFCWDTVEQQHERRLAVLNADEPLSHTLKVRVRVRTPRGLVRMRLSTTCLSVNGKTDTRTRVVRYRDRTRGWSLHRIPVAFRFGECDYSVRVRTRHNRRMVVQVQTWRSQ